MLAQAALFAADRANPEAAQDAADDAVVEESRWKVRFEDDGTGRREWSCRVRVNTEAAVRARGVLTLAYNAAFERLELRDVRLRKADGSTVEVPDSQAQEVTSPVARQFPVYSDHREKHLPVPGLRPGDRLEYTAVWTQHHPLAPGHFWFEHRFDRATVVLTETLEIDVPRDRALKRYVASGRDPLVADDAGRRSYRFVHEARREDVDAERRRLRDGFEGWRPDVALSTFRSWDELGAWYADLELQARQPGATVQAKAHELTRGAASDSEKAQALYEYVATRIRYVSLSLGMGAVRPHPAEETLANGYGDCKDKHTLLAALLAAAGIPSHAALVATTRELEPAVPSLQFDHVISVVTVGDGELWLDTTAEFAHFRWLWPAIRGKQALVVPPGGGARLREIPAADPTGGSVVVELEGRIDENGRLAAHLHQSLRGDSEVMTRTVFGLAPRDSWREGLQDYLNRIESGRDLKPHLDRYEIAEPTAVRAPFTIEMDYTASDFASWSEDPPALRLPLAQGGILYVPEPDELWRDARGRRRLPEMTQRFVARIELPSAWRARVPDDILLANGFGEYRARYRFEDHTLHVERTLKFKEGTLAEAQRQDYEKWREDVWDDRRRRLALWKEAASLEASAKACERGDTRACADLGARYASGDDADRDPARAQPLLDKACEGGQVEACQRLALLLRAGDGFPADLARAASLHERACDAAHMPACTDLGWAYSAGQGVATDLARSVALFRRACEGGHAHGCSNLGTVYDSGRGVEADPAQAVAFYRRACEGKSPEGCARWGQALREGRGTEKDEGGALRLFEQACDGAVPWACGHVGFMLSSGKGAPEDATRAATFFRKGCDAKDAYSCYQLGVQYAHGNGVERDVARGAVFYRKACDGGNLEACTALGDAHFYGDGVPRDMPAAAVLFEKACGSGVALACGRLGALVWRGDGVPQDLARANDLTARACDGGHGESCVVLGYFYESGRGVATDMKRAAGLYQKACDGATDAGCAALAAAYRAGNGVPRDERRAAGLFEKACTNGFSPACTGQVEMLLAAKDRAPDWKEVVRLLTRACDDQDARACAYLAALYEDGTGVANDRERARWLFQQACERGHMSACRDAERLSRPH